MWPSVDHYDVDMMNIFENIVMKVEHYKNHPRNNEQKLKLIVYGDNELLSRQMWKSMFRDDVDMYYSTDFPVFSVPARYTPDQYELYENELRKMVAEYLFNRFIVWGLYNLAVPEEDPRMHLVFINRLLKRSELGPWAQTKKSSEEGTVSGGAHPQDPRFISIESLQSLVSELPDFHPITCIPEVGLTNSTAFTDLPHFDNEPEFGTRHIEHFPDEEP